jgi:MtN3 and saliva related transmembrane protein
MPELIGYSAGVLTTLAFVPQVVKSWRSKSVGDLSFMTLCAFTAGVFLWLLYGIALRSLPVIAANGTTLVLSGILLGLKLRYERGSWRAV